MAASNSQNGTTRSSDRIRVLASREVQSRFLNSSTGDRPRTRAEKAALAAAGPRNGTLLDHFSITKPAPGARCAAKLSSGGGASDDTADHTPDTPDDDTAMSAAGSPGTEKGGRTKRKPSAAVRKSFAKKRRPDASSRSQRRSSTTAARDGGHKTTSDWLTPALQICWPEIFRLAATDADGVKQGWLLQAATVCAGLSEFAIDALYDSPEITSDKKMRRFTAALQSTDTRFYYRGKVRSLHLGPEFIPKLPALGALIRCLPRLQHFSIDYELDLPPYRDLETTGPKMDPVFWTVFNDRRHSRPGMVESPSPLLSWKWSGTLLGDFLVDSKDIMILHTIGPLRDLKKLHLLNFPHLSYDPETSSRWSDPSYVNPSWGLTTSQLPDIEVPTPDLQGSLIPEDEQDNYTVVDSLVFGQCAGVINTLQHLDHLVLEASAVVGRPLLMALPERLKHLEIKHCWNLCTHSLGDYLAASGRNLQTLILNHNSALELEFMTRLRWSCPRLEKLVINMSFYKDPDSKTAGPLFDEALGEDQVPTWPSSLRHVELVHVRPWKPEVAAVLFQSLMDSAHELPDLRYLVIKCMLDLDWRKRAELRGEWAGRLREVFLRPEDEPPAAISLKPIRAEESAGGDADAEREAEPEPPTRRSGRISAKHTAPARSSRRKRTSYAELSSDAEDDDSDESDGGGDDQDKKEPRAGLPGGQFVQGLCERVELTIENHKLAEVLFDMDDFVDAFSGEEESDSDFSS